MKLVQIAAGLVFLSAMMCVTTQANAVPMLDIANSPVTVSPNQITIAGNPATSANISCGTGELTVVGGGDFDGTTLPVAPETQRRLVLNG